MATSKASIDLEQPMLAAVESRRPPRLHLAHIDGIRALAATFVVLHHAWLTVWPVDHRVISATTLRYTGFLAFGNLAVCVFIVVSGFCLMLPVTQNSGRPRDSAVRFYQRRAFRILPPFYAAMVLSLVLIWLFVGQKTGTHWDVSIPIRPAGYIGNLLLLQDIIGKGQINHAFWSVAVEMQIYLWFPLLVWAYGRLGRIQTTALALLASLAGFALLKDSKLSGLTP